jgi:branched-chain amino acid transport system ATP-binding protein
MAAPLLSLSNLHAWYGPARVLHGIDLKVDAGEVVVLLGANGAGKTTLLRSVTGLVQHSGEIQFAGEKAPGSAVRFVRRGVAQVPEGRGTFSDLTVDENLEIGAYWSTERPRDRAKRRDRIIELFPILDQRHRQRAGLLSGGEQQMLAIGRALMSAPQLLLLDEPSLGLAPAVTKSVFGSLATLHREEGLSMLIVEQNAQISLAIAQRAYVMEAGVIKVEGTAATIESDDALRRAYLGY